MMSSVEVAIYGTQYRSLGSVTRDVNRHALTWFSCWYSAVTVALSSTTVLPLGYVM